jgi:hypothetical protein
MCYKMKLWNEFNMLVRWNLEIIQWKGKHGIRVL